MDINSQSTGVFVHLLQIKIGCAFAELHKRGQKNVLRLEAMFKECIIVEMTTCFLFRKE